jgi:hypothetical protein
MRKLVKSEHRDKTTVSQNSINQEVIIHACNLAGLWTDATGTEPEIALQQDPNQPLSQLFPVQLSARS